MQRRESSVVPSGPGISACVGQVSMHLVHVPQRSGGGFPGIPLAIWAEAALPDLKITVLDSNHKKSAFLRQAQIELKLGNLAANNFQGRFTTDDPTLLGRLGCTVLLSQGPLPPQQIGRASCRERV